MRRAQKTFTPTATSDSAGCNGSAAGETFAILCHPANSDQFHKRHPGPIDQAPAKPPKDALFGRYASSNRETRRAISLTPLPWR